MREPDLAALHPKETLEALHDFRFPPYITLAHIFHAPSDWGFADRQLKQYALNYVIDGRGEFTAEGTVYQVGKGDVFFYRPYEMHGLRSLPGAPFISITVVFHFADMPFQVDELLEGAAMLGCYEGHAIEHQFAELVALYRQPGLANRMQCQSLLLSLLSGLSRSSGAAKAESRKNLARLVLIKNQIENHLAEPLDVPEIERLSGLTWNYIIAEFRQAFGITPMQFLIWARITKAKELALQTPLSFSEIAERVGYNDVHAFGKMFKKKTGMSLTEFCSSLYETDHHIERPDQKR
ncbi:helix-turn-helix transcriptional regulator [Paenibacillus montanisoli]|nr:AraC family transcriptional regulator [Paenibacillus montanisoli]